MLNQIIESDFSEFPIKTHWNNLLLQEKSHFIPQTSCVTAMQLFHCIRTK